MSDIGSWPPPPPREPAFAEPYRAGDWQQPRRRRSWRAVAVVLVIAFAFGAGLAFASLSRPAGTLPADVGAEGARVSVAALEPGSCLEGVPDSGPVNAARVLPCGEPHGAEVVASYRIGGEEWPGDDAARDAVLGHCGTVIQPASGEQAMFRATDWSDGVRWVAWIPDEASWSDGQRSGLCVVHREQGLVGSFVARDVDLPGRA